MSGFQAWGERRGETKGPVGKNAQPRRSCILAVAGGLGVKAQEELYSHETAAREALGTVSGRVTLSRKICSQCGKGFTWLEVGMDGLTPPQFLPL